MVFFGTGLWEVPWHIWEAEDSKMNSGQIRARWGKSLERVAEVHRLGASKKSRSLNDS